MSEKKDLVIPELNKNQLATRFTSGVIDKILIEIREKALSEYNPSIETEKSRKAISSLAYKVSRTKTFIDGVGKELVSGWKSKAAAVDSERKKVKDGLDALRNEIQKPLREWEQAEEERLAVRESRISEIENLLSCEPISSNEGEKLLEKLSIIESFDWQEFKERADACVKKSRNYLNAVVSNLKQKEKEEREAEQLRKEEAERLQKEKEERFVREAENRARREAEEKAEREKRAEQDRIAREKDEAERKARAEKEEYERKLKVEREFYERKLKVEKEFYESKERERLEAEKEAEKKEQARIANKQHRDRIKQDAVESLESYGIKDVNLLVDLIETGKIKNIFIKF